MSTPAAVSSNSTIQEDIPCGTCGYNMRGLERAGRCPECGVSIDEMVRQHEAKLRDGTRPLGMAAAWWVKRLWLGGVTVLIAGTVYLSAVLTVLAIGQRGIAQWEGLVIILISGSMIAMAAGVWMLETREPIVAASKWDSASRWIARVGTLLLAIDLTFGTVLRLGNYALMLLFYTITAASIAATWIIMLRLASMSGRMSRPWLRRSAIVLAWGIPAFELVRHGFGPGGIPVTRTSGWSVMPIPVLGDLAISVLLPYARYHRPVPQIGWWLVAAILNLTAICVVGFSTWSFYRIARRKN